tara:strand:+ start:542 stop:667 length:126 start_codon:yes stop_codon:yes gene_type:complete
VDGSGGIGLKVGGDAGDGKLNLGFVAKPGDVRAGIEFEIEF